MKLMLIKSMSYIYIFFACCVAAYALSFYWHPENPFRLRYQSMKTLMVYSHFIGAGFALLFGALQILTKPGSRFHKHLGYGYCMAVVVGAMGGFYLAFHSYLGAVTGVGFLLANILWLGSTFMAIQRIYRSDVQGHRAWMLRSVALTSSGITLRILLPILSSFLTFDTSYTIVAWLAWMTNLIAIEIYLQIKPQTHIKLKGTGK